MNPLVKSLKAIRDLGLPKLWYYTLYQIGLRSGHYRRVTPSRHSNFSGGAGLPPYANFPQVTDSQRDLTLSEADEIIRGTVRLFGGQPVPLDLESGASSRHWSILEQQKSEGDIKFIWEPARFGWAVTLARAYAFSGNPAYARNFWEKTLTFLTAHPPNLGPQWQSGQEVAIRLMVLLFCDRVLATAPSSTLENRARLLQAVAEHAQRIPPTMVYARAQNNNHLISEAAGLYAAGIYLSDHPQASEWRCTGWHWLNWGFQHQINEFGTYIQHSTNYHRLMLQLALFSDHLRRQAGDSDWPLTTRARLDAATRWLWGLTDPESGRVPNLGANDSAYIFPLTNAPIGDYRPVVDAAAKAFLNQDIYKQPNHAEMADWFELSAAPAPVQDQPHTPDMLRVTGEHGRAFIHTAQYYDRPSHADQLHTDLWWQGVNIAPDPGTYQYNAQPPWDNALAATHVHNTVALNGQDQMLRAGRFLWLDWAQAQILAHEIGDQGQLRRVTAEHDGYRKRNALHQRTILAADNGWDVLDTVLPIGDPDQNIHRLRLTWLAPDWTWGMTSDRLIHLTGPGFSCQLLIEGADQVNLFRAGQSLYGELSPDPTWGWVSPTYGSKQPALMIVAIRNGHFPIHLQSIWRFDS